MKRPVVKIGVALLSIFILLLVSVCGVVCWVVSSENGIKKFTGYVIDHWSPYRIEVGTIKLSPIKAFPEIGLTLKNVTVFNEPGTAPEDTMLYVDGLFIKMDADAYFKEDRIEVQKIGLENVKLSIFTDSCGNGNLDIFSGHRKKTDSAERAFTIPDSLNTVLSFNLQQMSAENLSLEYTDLSTSTYLKADNIGADIQGGISPDLDGKAVVDIKIADAYFSHEDSTCISAILGALKMKADVVLEDNIADSHINLCSGTASFAADSIRSLAQNLSLDFNGIIDIKNRIIDGKASVESDRLSAESENFDALISRASVQMDVDGDMALSDTADAALQFKAGAISFSSNGDCPISLSADDAEMTASAECIVKLLQGSADISLKTRALKFRIDNDSVFSASAKSMEFAVYASNGGDGIISLEPSISFPSLLVSNGNTKYIDGYPVRLSVPLATDTSFTYISSDNALITLDGQPLYVSAGIQHTDKCNEATVRVKTNALDIEKTLSMLPQSAQAAISAIKPYGTADFDITGKVSLNNGTFNLESAGADISTRNSGVVVDDTISAYASDLSVKVRLPETVPFMSDIQLTELQASNFNFNIESASPVMSNIASLSAKAKIEGLPHGSASDGKITADVSMSDIFAAVDTLSADIESLNLNGSYSLTDGGASTQALDARIILDGVYAILGGGHDAEVESADVFAKAELDTTKKDFLMRWKPEMKVSVSDAALNGLPLQLDVPNVDFDFSLGKFTIRKSSLTFGNSEFSLAGDIRDIDAFIDRNGTMEGELDFVSDYTDMDEIMTFLSGIGRESIESERSNTPFAQNQFSICDTLSTGISDTCALADPFMVPMGMNVVFNTNISNMNFNRHSFKNVGGNITIKDGTLILQELGFSSDAAQMQLTAIYRTPEPDNIYTGLDFHLLDIDIKELIDLIPSVDSVVPMLKYFEGKAQFHLAAETNLDGYYVPKMPTLIGAAAIEGCDLQVMDTEVFNNIKKKLLMSKNAENRIDSLSVELQVLRNKVDLYPFLVHMDRYSAVIGGRHNINKSLDCNYHISITETPLPIRLGINISGPISDIASRPMRHIKLSKCLYDNMFTQKSMNATDLRIMQMKEKISETLKGNVK